MKYTHSSSISDFGFKTQIETTGLVGGDDSETIIGIIPEPGCQFEFNKSYDELQGGLECKEEAIYLKFCGDCELICLKNSLKFLLKIINAAITLTKKE